jgi:hypothetical protein
MDPSGCWPLSLGNKILRQAKNTIIGFSRILEELRKKCDGMCDGT